MFIEQRQLEYHNGKYSAEIDITIEEWKTMLLDDKIFNDTSLDMICKWFLQMGHQSTHGEIMKAYANEYAQYKSTPFNGIVNGLSKRILRYLNRFEVMGTKENKSYFIIPFEGWHETHKPSGAFVWKLRDELVQAIEELQLFDDIFISIDDELESVVADPEGKKTQYFTTRYERSQKNRTAAIRFHGLSCCVCGFQFENIYGELGKNYIEVHHCQPLYSKEEIVSINPETDLVCICSNCHRMIHRKKDKILSPDELKSILNEKRY